MNKEIRIVRSSSKSFSKVLGEITGRGAEDTQNVEGAVREIIDGVRTRGDEAIFDYTRAFDRVDLKGRLRVSEREINKGLKSVSKRDIEIMELSRDRIESFHRRQLQNSWFTTEEDGTVLGQRVTPVKRAGLYVPGGKAAYPPTVLMHAVPAKVAGVSEVTIVTPPGKGGTVNPYVLAAAKVAGVTSILRIGGAQSIAALAYGSFNSSGETTVERVDKIVGPGNIYVATAKRLVFGAVDIDMVAGPSEILVINDGPSDSEAKTLSTEAEWIAADLLSQAEHDELASGILVTTSSKMAKAVQREVTKQLGELNRRKIAEAAVERACLIIVAGSLDEAAGISNSIAPEHLELFVSEPFELMGKITDAGAIFLGPYTPEATGDYMAGPNHTLPTGGTARFSSPLGVDDFIKRSSVISLSKEALLTLGPKVDRFARLEGLDGHAKSVTKRLASLKKKKR